MSEDAKALTAAAGSTMDSAVGGEAAWESMLRRQTVSKEQLQQAAAQHMDTEKSVNTLRRILMVVIIVAICCLLALFGLFVLANELSKDSSPDSKGVLRDESSDAVVSTGEVTTTAELTAFPSLSWKQLRTIDSLALMHSGKVDFFRVSGFEHVPGNDELYLHTHRGVTIRVLNGHVHLMYAGGNETLVQSVPVHDQVQLMARKRVQLAAVRARQEVLSGHGGVEVMGERREEEVQAAVETLRTEFLEGSRKAEFEEWVTPLLTPMGVHERAHDYVFDILSRKMDLVVAKSAAITREAEFDPIAYADASSHPPCPTDWQRYNNGNYCYKVFGSCFLAGTYSLDTVANIYYWNSGVPKAWARENKKKMKNYCG